MPLQVRRTGNVEYGRWIKALIGGEPGAGKTKVSATFPYPFFASAEGGMMSVAADALPYVDITTIDDLHEFKRILDKGKNAREERLGARVDTVIIDTIDEIQRLLIRKRLDDTRKTQLSRDDWSPLAEQMQSIVRGFRNLDLHVVFTCHLKNETDGESGKVSYRPQLQGQFADQIAAQVDLALLLKEQTSMKMVEGKAERQTVRVLQTYKDAAHDWIKDRSGKLPGEFVVNFGDDFARMNELIFAGIGELPQSTQTEVETDPLPVLTPPIPLAEAPTVMPRAPRQRPTVVPRAPQPEPTPSVSVVAAETPTDTPTEAPPAPPSDVIEGIKVRNPPAQALPASIKPKLKDHNTNLFCQMCGNEVESEERADLSRIRFRKILCIAHFEELKQQR